MDINNDHGSILITVAVAMTLLSTLAVGIVSLKDSSALNESKVNNLNRARYLAESGLRHAYIDIFKNDTHETGTYTLTGGGKFVVGGISGSVCTVTGIVAEGSIYEARNRINYTYPPPAGIPPTPEDPGNNRPIIADPMDKDKGKEYTPGKVDFQKNITTDWGNHDEWATFKDFDEKSTYTEGATNCATSEEMTEFNVETPDDADKGWSYEGDGIFQSINTGNNKSAQMMFSTRTGEGDFSFSLKVSSQAERDYFIFYIDGIEMLRASGEVGWETVSFPVTEGDHVFLWKYVKDESQSGGKSGGGSDDDDDKTSKGDDKAMIKDVVIPGTSGTHLYKYESMRFVGTSSNPIDWTASWLAGGKLLSYDVQVKHLWGEDLRYGADGISFRWTPHPVETGKYQGYGVSFMFHKGICENDYIPDALKPPGTEQLPLIVLWQQTVDENGDTAREWLAYKDLSADPYVVGNQWEGDGRRFNDLSSLFVRIEERRDIRGKKYNDIKVFYGDAAKVGGHGSNSGGNSDPLDTVRRQYPPTYEFGNKVKWPPNTISDWDSAVDYMTLVKWDVINGTSSDDFSLLANGYTVRSRSLTTPDDSFPDPTNGHGGGEVALHAFGNITYEGSGGNFDVISFDDFNTQILGQADY